MYIKLHDCIICGQPRADVCPTCIRNFFMYEYGIAKWTNSQKFIDTVNKDFNTKFECK